MPEGSGLSVDLARLKEGLAMAAGAIGVGEPPPPKPPVAFGDAVRVAPGASLEIPVLVNDQPGDRPLDLITLVVPPAKGQAEVAGGIIRYSANADATGFDALQYTVTDEGGEVSNLATVSIRLRPVGGGDPGTPPAGHGRKLLGMAPVASQTRAGGPADSLAMLTRRLEPNLLQGGRKFDLVAIFGLIDHRNLLKPGRGYKADLFASLSERGQLALITLPILWRQHAADDGGPGDFDSVIAGRFDQDFIDFFKHLDDSGQAMCRLRIGHEGDLRGSFPWGVNYDWQGVGSPDNFKRQRAAMGHVIGLIRQYLPQAMVVRCHFWQPQVRVVENGQRRTYYLHPDEVLCDPADCDAICVDWYDGKGQVVTRENWQQQWNQQGPNGEPWGLDRWMAYGRGHGKLVGVDEWGLMIRDDMSEAEKLARDNPEFIEVMWDWFQAQGDDLAHLAYFHLGDTESKLVPQTRAGTRRATDAWLRSFGQAP